VNPALFKEQAFWIPGQTQNDTKQKNSEKQSPFFARNFCRTRTQVIAGIGRVVPIDIQLVVVPVDVRNIAVRIARTRILLNSVYLTENQKIIFCVIRLKPATFMDILQKELSKQFLFKW